MNENEFSPWNHQYLYKFCENFVQMIHLWCWMCGGRWKSHDLLIIYIDFQYRLMSIDVLFVICVVLNGFCSIFHYYGFCIWFVILLNLIVFVEMFVFYKIVIIFFWFYVNSCCCCLNSIILFCIFIQVFKVF